MDGIHKVYVLKNHVPIPSVSKVSQNSSLVNDVEDVEASPPNSGQIMKLSLRSHEETSSGSTTTYSDSSFSKYDSFILIFDSSHIILPYRSDFHEEFADELAQIISQPEYDCFFKDEPELGNFTMDVDCPDCEDSQFCHSSRVSHPQLHLGIRYPNLID
ncbi:hypothetical protein Tco_0743150 [Tanacetum coccineum]